MPEAEFPPRAARQRRRRPKLQRLSSRLKLPSRTDTSHSVDIPQDKPSSVSEILNSSESSVPVLEPSGSDSATPTTSQAPSETESTQPTTPSSAVPPPILRSQQLPINSKTANRQSGRVLPIVPIIPNIPTLSKSAKRQSISIASDTAKPEEHAPNGDYLDHALEVTKLVTAEEELSEETPKEPSPQIKAMPKSWADLVRTKAPALAPAPAAIKTNDTESNLGPASNGFVVSKASSLSDVLTSFSVNTSNSDNRVTFLKPRGLVNTGNMCYMNSVCRLLFS